MIFGGYSKSCGCCTQCSKIERGIVRIFARCIVQFGEFDFGVRVSYRFVDFSVRCLKRRLRIEYPSDIRELLWSPEFLSAIDRIKKWWGEASFSIVPMIRPFSRVPVLSRGANG